MGDEVDDLDLPFDASLKKKKKKKKPFDLEAALEGSDASTPEVTAAAEDAADATAVAADAAVSTLKAEDEDDDINLDFGGLKKKKKKKKVVIDLGDEDSAPAELPEAETEPIADAPVDDGKILSIITWALHATHDL